MGQGYIGTDFDNSVTLKTTLARIKNTVFFGFM